MFSLSFNDTSVASSLTDLIGDILYLIGMWAIFVKFGKKGWYALIPFKNAYVLGECAGREIDGVTFMLLSGIGNIMSALSAAAAQPGSPLAPLNEIPLYIFAYITVYIIYYVYRIRIFIGLIEKFGKSKKWIFAWAIFDGIMVLWWGLSKKIVPVETKENVSDAVFDDSTAGVDLTVDIKERKVTNIIKTKTLLKDIRLTVPKGHMVLLLGGSGAGKTTFLNAVTGYEKANANIMLGTSSVYKDYKSMKYDIGFVPQQDLMRGNDTVYRTIADAASLRLPMYMKIAEKKERIDGVLNKFGLGAVRSSLVDKLSGGQRKRLSIAMEYISNPSLFILDEPDSGLDGIVARELFESLRSIADTGKIVMVITHTPDRVIDLFDDVIVLAKDSSRTGRLAYYGSVEKAYEFFGKTSMEQILLSINQKEEGGEGRAEEFVAKYAGLEQAEVSAS